jgi:hypothetical protein
LDVEWSGDPQGEIAGALEGLGLAQSAEGRYVAEGEGPNLIRLVGAVRDLERRVRSESNDDVFTVRFQDPVEQPSDSALGPA